MLVLLLFAILIHAESSDDALRTAKIVFRHELGGITSIQTMYLDRPNHRIRQEQEMVNGEWSQVMFFDGTRIGFMSKGGLGDGKWYVRQPTSGDLSWVEAALGGADTTLPNRSGSETVAERKCAVYESEDETIWVWEGVVLKRIRKLGEGHERLEAINIEENIPLSPSLFDFPAGITPLEESKHPIPPVQ